MAIKTIDEIFRDFETDGVPGSGQHKPIKRDIRDTLNALLLAGIVTVSDRVQLKAVNTTRVKEVFLNEDGREGFFTWEVGNFTALVAADTLEGVYIKSDATAASSGAWVRYLEDDEITPQMFGAKVDGVADDTAPAQAAINFFMANPKIGLGLSGTISASKLSFGNGPAGHIRANNCMIKANSAAAQTCVVEFKSHGISVEGKLTVSADYRTNYECAVWLWNEVSSQFNNLRNIVVNAAIVGFRIGTEAYAGALISETVLEAPQSYGCPIPMEVIGGETYITITSPTLSADSFGGNPAWEALPKRSLRNIGATVIVIGGEVLMVDSTSGGVVYMHPINRGGGRVEWGSIIFNGVVVETAAPLCVTDNGGGLVINNAASNRRGMIQFNNCVGYHSQDLAAVIFAEATYDDFIIVNQCNFWHPGATRTQPNIFCAGGSTAEITVIGDFGPGFKEGLAGISGGRVNFSRRHIFKATNLSGRAFTAASGAQPCLYQAVDTTGDRIRFGSAFTAGTGIFTVPDGGLKDVVVDIKFRLAGTSTGDLIIFGNGGEAVRTKVVGGVGNLNTIMGDLPSGYTIQVLFDTDVNDTGSTTVYLNEFSILARRGQL